VIASPVVVLELVLELELALSLAHATKRPAVPITAEAFLKFMPGVQQALNHLSLHWILRKSRESRAIRDPRIIRLFLACNVAIGAVTTSSR
jgi:hypothetical protein